MDPFDWTQDRELFPRCQLWSEKAKHALKTMEGDPEEMKISYFHHWINSKGMEQIASWKRNRILIPQEELDRLTPEQKVGKYSSDYIENYFTLFDSILQPKSNPLLAAEDLRYVKQGSMTAGEFHGHVTRIVKRCQFPNPQAEERATRDALHFGMNSQKIRDKAVNLMNEHGKEVTVEFLIQQLEIEDCNAHHKSFSQLGSTGTVNMVAYDRRQNRGRSNKPK